MRSNNSYSLSELSTLSYLYPDQALSTAELAGMLRIKAQSMSEILSNLKNQEIIDKTPHETDKRKSLISLTQKGRQIVELARYEKDEWLAQAIENTLSAVEKKTLQDAIAILIKIETYESNI